MDEQSIFLAALACPIDDDRSRLLEQACGDNPELKQRVKMLLRNFQGAESFLESPAFASPTTVAPSVLESLSEAIGDVPRVVLKEAQASPIVRPNSPEMPRDRPGGKYELHGEIARGGMGLIVKGRDKDLGRDLVIKVLLDANSEDPEHVRRFVEEAQISGQLQHPGIVPVYELGQLQDRRPFFSMKLVKGQTLAALLSECRDGAKELSKFIGIFEQVCQTMAYAHSRGVIHRDLKPANIMVGAFGEVQVMDWGLAKVLAEGGKADERRASQKHQDVSIIRTLRNSSGDDSASGAGSDTRAGSVMGTYAYMSPEQARGEVDRLDERVDVFALGAILTEILTDKPPYPAKQPQQIHRLACRGDLNECFTRLDACVAEDDLKRIAKDCLNSDLAGRPRNAGAVADRIVTHQRGLQQRVREAELEKVAADTRAAEEHRRRRLSRAISVLLSCVLVAAVIFAVVYRRLAAREEHLREIAVQHARLENISRVAAESRALSGEYATASVLLASAAVEMSRASGDAGLPLAHAALLQSTQAISIAGRPIKVDALPINDMRLTENYLIAVCDKEIRLWNYKAENPAMTLKVLGDASNTVENTAVSRDGRWMVTSGSRLLLWDLHAEAIRPVVIANRGASLMALSENGRWLAVQGRPERIETGEEASIEKAVAPIHLWELIDGGIGESRTVTTAAQTMGRMAVSSDGRWIVGAGDESRTMQLWDLHLAREEPLEMELESRAVALLFSPDARRLIAKVDSWLRMWDLTTTDPFESSRGVRSYSEGAFVRVSPDSKWVYAVGTNARELRRWTLDDLDVSTPEFRLIGPDAGFTTLATSFNCRWFLGGSCDGKACLWGDLDSTQPPEDFMPLQTYFLGPTQLEISPDGRWIATAQADGVIRLRDLRGFTNLPLVLEGPPSTRDAPIGVSSDGRWIASSTDDAKVILWDTQSQAPAGVRRVLPASAEVGYLAFSPDDRWLVAGIRNGTHVIWDVASSHDMPPKRVLGTPAAIHRDNGVFAISPDSCLLATGHPDNTVRLWDLRITELAEPIHTLQGHAGPIVAMLISPDGRWLATSDHARTVRLWNLKDATPQASSVNLGMMDGRAFSLAIDADSRWLAVGGGDEVWLCDLSDSDLSRPHRVLKPKGEDELAGIYRLAISPNGRWLFTSRFNATAQLFDLHEDNPVARQILTPGVQDSMISSDGHWLAMCKRGPNLQLFDLTADDPTRTWRVLTCHGDTLWRVGISADSRWLVTSSGEGRIRRWNLDLDWLLSYAREMAGRQLTADERLLYGLDD